MMVWATLKWQGIYYAKRLRWVLVSACVLLGVFALLSLPVFGLYGNGALWFLYLPIALTGAYISVFLPALSFEDFAPSHLHQRTVSRPYIAIACVKTLYNILFAFLGLGLIFLASVVYHRLGLQQFELWAFMHSLTNMLHHLPGGFFIGWVYTAALFCPPALLVVNASVHSQRRWTRPLPLLFIVFVGIGVGALLFFSTSPDYDFFAGGISSPLEVIVTVLLVLYPAAALALGAWLYDNKADIGNGVGF